MALFYTVISGIFILIGALVAILTKKNKKFIQFSISMALGVMVMLVCIELIPESQELIGNYVNGYLKGLIMFVFVISGMLLLKVLDMFIPDHEIENENIKSQNLYHIGIVSSVALILHNIIEGMMIYSSSVTDVGIGFLLTLGVGLHNIPMGMVIESTISSSNSSKLKNILNLIVISSSTLIGGIIMLLLKKYINDLVLGILFCITLGMLIYIIVFELLGEVIESKDKKTSLMGIIVGIVIFLFSFFLE